MCEESPNKRGAPLSQHASDLQQLGDGGPHRVMLEIFPPFRL